MQDPMERYGELIDEIHKVAVSFQDIARREIDVMKELRHVVSTNRLEARENEHTDTDGSVGPNRVRDCYPVRPHGRGRSRK